MRLAFILLFFCTAAHGQFIIDPYRFGDGIIDLLANSGSILLDGTAEYVSVPDADDLSQTDDKITIMAWTSAISRTNFIIANKDDEYLIQSNGSNVLEARFIDASTGGYIGRTGGAIGSEYYTHIAVTFDGTTVKIYDNGEQSDNADANSGSYTAMENTVNDLWIGYDGTNYADGRMDQVVIFDTVLTADEIKEAMAIRDYNYHSRAGNLVSWWDFDDDDVTAGGITDRVGTNNGTAENAEAADINPLVAWPFPYQLDTTATANSLTPMQSATDSTYGGFSWRFEAGEYFEVADADTFSFGDGSNDEPFSISYWYFCGASGGCSDQHSSIWKYSGSDNEYYVSYTTNRWLFALRPANLIWRMIATNTFVHRKYGWDWILITITYDGRGGASAQLGCTFYINGVDETDRSYVNNAGTYVAMSNTAAPLQVYAGAGENSIADVILWDKELSSAEINSIYNMGGPRDERQYELSGNIVGYWTAQNSSNTSSGVEDLSGNDNHGTMTNTEDGDIWYAYPREALDSAGSFDFDGVDEYIDCGDNDNFTFVDQPFTVSVRLNPDGAWTSQQFVSKVDGTNYEWALGTVNSLNRLAFILYDANTSTAGGRYYTRGSDAYLGWQHWVGVYDGSGNAHTGIDLYWNGQINETANYGSSAITCSNTDAPINIGRADLGGFQYFNGQMGHVTIIDKALSTAEVQELYNAGMPPDITKVTFADNIVSHWNLDATDDATGTVTDIVGTNDGTATNMEAGDKSSTLWPLTNNGVPGAKYSKP